MKLEAVPFKKKLIWKQKGQKLEAFKDQKFQLSIVDKKIHFKNGFSSQQYKTVELAIEAAENFLKQD